MKKRKRDTQERGNGPRPLVDCETVLMDSLRWAITFTFSFSFIFSCRRWTTTSHSKSFYRSDFLYHHGILGQRWGKRNGPPYPLDAQDHSASEKKAGWKKSLDKSSDKEYNKSGNSEKEPHEKRHLTDKQKRAIKIGAAVAVTALAAVGTAYLVRSGKLDGLIARGKGSFDHIDKKQRAVESIGQIDLDDVPIIGKSPTQIDLDMVSRINGPESERESIERKINCANTTTSYILNSVFGMDTVAKGHSGIVDEKSGEVILGQYPEIFNSMFDGIKISDDYLHQYKVNELIDRKNKLVQKNMQLMKY